MALFIAMAILIGICELIDQGCYLWAAAATSFIMAIMLVMLVTSTPREDE